MLSQIKITVGLLASVLLQQALVAAEVENDQQLLTNFWQATTSNEREKSRQELISAAGDVSVLYQWLSAGPTYSADVAVGQFESTRLDSQGVEYPYVVLIPDSYDSTKSYPVEFMLHGGVSRPAWEAGGGWWRRGYDSLKQADRIMVVPAAWNEAFWWHDNQADSLPEILRSIKQSYNVDDNRVTLTGVSDGGTGAYFFAFKQPTEWAAFLPYIAHPGVLRNAQSGGGYRLYFENLYAKPLYIVNGENDPLYPVSAVRPFIDILQDVGVSHIFKPIANGGHNTNWLSEELPEIEKFKLDNPRDPFPDQLVWVSDRTDRYNRNLWIRVDALTSDTQPGILEVSRMGNKFEVTAGKVAKFTLLLNPQEVDFDSPITVNVNGSELFSDLVTQDMETLLRWAHSDLDKSMLFTAELTLDSSGLQQ